MVKNLILMCFMFLLIECNKEKERIYKESVELRSNVKLSAFLIDDMFEIGIYCGCINDKQLFFLKYEELLNKVTKINKWEFELIFIEKIDCLNKHFITDFVNFNKKYFKDNKITFIEEEYLYALEIK